MKSHLVDGFPQEFEPDASELRKLNEKRDLIAYLVEQLEAGNLRN